MSEDNKKWPLDHPQHKFNHPSFIQPEDKSVRVWRYFDLPKFIWLLNNRKLFFPRLEMFSDPHEGANTRLGVELRNRILENDENRESLLAQWLEYSRNVRKQTYVSCWNIGYSESEAMWKLYCPDSQGVALQTTYEKLSTSLDDEPNIFIGLVRYLDYEEGAFAQGNLFDLVMHKRLSFIHEQEVRLVKYLSLEESEKNSNGITVEWPIVRTIEKIYINPYAPEYFADVVKSIVRRFEPTLEKRICWSQMRATPLH
jgi:hypothetical protein